MNPTLNNPTPQFGTAEYLGTPGGDHCQFCHQPIGLTYYRANDAMTCPACAESMRGELAKDTHAAFTRALIFGIGAAILGLVLYATFAIVTGIVIGYASLAVGWIIGKAMITGSKGIGGRRYQVVAVLLTYAAVSMAAIPVMIDYARKHPRELQTQQQKAAPADNDNLDAPAAQQKTRSESSPAFGIALAELALWGLASPFLELFGDPMGGLIGLVILFVGMRFAWRFTTAKPVEIFGPFENSPQPAP
jgi:ABC-type antimicrobial peptide transport system permease subunit